MALRGAGQPKSKSPHSAETPSSRLPHAHYRADSMSTRNSRAQAETRQLHLPPHTRLALSVIERAVKDIKYDDASLHRSAARFLNGSEDFYFWARTLEQDSNWLLRRLHVRLRNDSPRAFERLLPGGVAVHANSAIHPTCLPADPVAILTSADRVPTLSAVDNADQLKAFLASHKGKFYCNRCLSKEVGIKNPVQVNQLTRPLRGLKPYRHGKITCHGCHEYRHCISHT